MKPFQRSTWLILLQCCVIVTVYQLATCLAEEQSVQGHSQTGTHQPESQDSETLHIQRQQCTNSIHGIPGVPGIPGSPGPMGPPGLKGQDGLVGLKGNKGDPGPKGDGQQGQKGTQGSPGQKGDKGNPGQKGEGQNGQKGVQGKPGPKGDRGDPGHKGSTGQNGPTGPRGPPGQHGPPGQQGQKGDKGQAREIPNVSRMAFSVARTSQLGPVSEHTAVIYDKVYANVGNAYDASIGKFTCSVSGVYFFMFSSLRAITSSNLLMCLMKNDTQLPCVYLKFSPQRIYGSASNSVIIDLQPGDEVWVRLYNGNSLYSNIDDFVTFTGYLLYETS
ncbi:complement C1q and tumor necrosis factor-related protein 9-like [Ptychodera flava]|uniref:complement C1q and tumor necrosis factor-related protein 9-like n=1 Tax=Ptychodera flava TaxID=63121 RepID=UPI00396A2534